MAGSWQSWNGWLWWVWQFKSGWHEWKPGYPHLLRCMILPTVMHNRVFLLSVLNSLHAMFGDLPQMDEVQGYYYISEQMAYDADNKSDWYYDSILSYSLLVAIYGLCYKACALPQTLQQPWQLHLRFTGTWMMHSATVDVAPWFNLGGGLIVQGGCKMKE